jgi:hypothetical protein
MGNLLSSIEILNAFPNERIRLKAPKTLPTINSIRFDSGFKKLNSPNQLNSTTNYLSSSPYPTYNMNPDNHILTFSYPQRFPLDWYVGLENDTFVEAEIINSKGVTGVTVFPTHPFPLLQGYNDYSVTLSSVLVSAQVFNESSVNLDWNGYDISYDLLLNSNDKQFGQFTTFMYFPCAYFGGSRTDEIFSTVTHETSTLSANFLTNILPNTLEITIPITNIDPLKSPIGYTGDSIYLIFDPKRNGLLKGRNRSDLNSNPISSNITYATGEFGLDYNHGYFVSAGNCTASYRSSAYATETMGVYVVSSNVPITIPGNLGTDYFRLSSTLPIYFYNIPLSFQGTALTNSKYPTMYWNLSTSSVNNGTSAVTITAVMRDNYKQGWWNLDNSGTNAVLSYEDLSLSDNLSCFVNGNYVSPNQTVPASSVLTFRNNDLFQTYTVQTTLSTFTDSIQKSNTKFSLNADKANFTVLLTAYDNSLIAELDSDAILDKSIPIKWDFNDSQYIELYSLSAKPITLNTDCYLTSSTTVSARQLGVLDTIVICYNSEYNISATNTWHPTSGSYLNTTASVSGNFDNAPEIPIGDLQALLIKNGKTYNIPDNSYIGWSMVPTQSVAISLSAVNGNEVFLNGNIYSGYNGKKLNYTIDPSCADVSPAKINMPFEANIYNDLFNVTTNTFQVEFIEKPCNAGITFQVLSAGTKLYDSNNSCNTAVLSTGSYSLTLSANLSTLNAETSAIHWFTNGSLLSAGTLSATLEMSSATASLSCVTVSASMVSAKFGAFPEFDYSDSLCFCFDEVLDNLDFIVYPENQWNGTQFVTITSSTLSQGPSAYGNCHNECFVISAKGGFNTYDFKIGDDIYSQSSNVLRVCRTTTTTKTETIEISAYNDCYSKNCPTTLLNYVSSTVGDPERDKITFKAYDDPTNNSSINDTVFNLNDPYNENLLSLTASFPYTNSPVQVVSGDLVLTLIDIEGNQKTKNVILVANDNVLEDNWDTFNPNSFLYLKENTVGFYSLKMSGTILQIIPSQDFCARSITMPTKTFNITAVSGPELAFYTEKNCLSTNEVFEFENNSILIDNSFGLSTIKIDFGDSMVSALSADFTTASHNYSANGTYSWNVTGYLKNGLNTTRTFTNFIKVSQPQLALDRDVQRSFPSYINLPYTCADIADFSNEWINSKVFNERVGRVFENIQYIQENSFIYNPDLPISYVGWLGNNLSNGLKWNYNEYDQQTQKTFSQIQDMVQDDGHLFVVDNNSFKIYENQYYPRLLVDRSVIGEDESWKELKTIQKKLNLISLLDRGNHAVYFYKWNGKFGLKLLYYFGGWGNSSSKYKFNNPRDFCHYDNIIVCDTDNKCVKVYDQTYSWLKTESYNMKPISISQNASGIYVLFETGDVYKLNSDFNVVKTWKVSDLKDDSKIRTNDEFVYVNGVVLKKYTLNGNLVGEFKKQLKNTSINAVAFSEGNLYLTDTDKIHKVCDNDTYFDLRNIVLDDDLYPLSSVEIMPIEFVTSEVYKDSFFKIYQNLTTLNNSFSARFYEILNPETDIFETFETRSYSPSSVPLLSSTIGLNECVNNATIGREFNIICDNLHKLEDILKSETIYQTFSAECLTWENTMLSTAHAGKGGNIKALSWYEITRGMECPEHGECYDTYNSYFSAISAFDTVFQIPYSLGACEYVTTNFTEVSCNSALGLINFSQN